MGKTPKLKNRGTFPSPYSNFCVNSRLAPSIHSRAARRAASPSLDTDKSLADFKPPTSRSTHVSFKAQDAGVRKKKAKPLRRGQRLRQQKGLDRAEIVMDQLESKVTKSVGKLKTRKERKKEWTDINLKTGQRSRFSALQDKAEGDVEDIDGGVEVEMNGTEKENRNTLLAGTKSEKGGELELPLRPPAEPSLPADDEDEAAGIL